MGYRLVLTLALMLWLLPSWTFVSHISRESTVFQRYSIPYFVFLLSYISGLLIGLTFLRATPRQVELVTRVIAYIRRRRWLLAFVLVVSPIASLALFFVVSRFGPGQSTVFFVSILSLALLADAVLVFSTRSQVEKMNLPVQGLLLGNLSLYLRREFLLKLGMATLGPLSLLALLEGGAYAWERTQANGPYAWELVASRRIEQIEYHQPGAGYTLMEPGSHYVWQGISVDINAYGLRGPETTYEKPPNTFRILNLGDSIVMGWGIREEETYGRQLERLLNEQTAEGLRYEVINAGVPGWNPENELAYLRAEGLKYEPDLVLHAFTVVNDIHGRGAQVNRDNHLPLIEWLRANTYFWPFLTVQQQWLWARANGRNLIPVLDPPTEPARYFPLDPAASRWATVWGWVHSMNHLAEENDIPFALVLFPIEFQVLDAHFPTLAQELLTAKAAEAGIPVLDLLPAFQLACEKKPDSACHLEDPYLFADNLGHPSAYGHELAATEVRGFLDGILEKR
jgi:hypothetical protein